MIIADWFNKYFTGIVQEVADKTLTSHIPNKTFLSTSCLNAFTVLPTDRRRLATSSSGLYDLKLDLTTPILGPLSMISNFYLNTGIVPISPKMLKWTRSTSSGIRTTYMYLIIDRHPFCLISSTCLKKSCTSLWLRSQEEILFTLQHGFQRFLTSFQKSTR